MFAFRRQFGLLSTLTVLLLLMCLFSFPPSLVCLFLKRGADYNARDKNNKDPITIAVDNANADIVTLWVFEWRETL